MALKLARDVGLHRYRGEILEDAHAADRFEAYLAALLSSNGRRSLLKFLVPLIQREFFSRFSSIPTLKAAPAVDEPQYKIAVGETVPGPLLGQTESLTTATHEFRSRIWKHHLEQCLNLVAEIKLLNYTIAIGQGLTTLAANAALLNDALKKGLIIVEPTFAPRRYDLPLQYRSHAQIDSQAIHDLLDLDKQRSIRLTHTWKFTLPGQEAIAHSGSTRYSTVTFREMVRKCCLAGLIEVKDQASLNPTKSEPSPRKARYVDSSSSPPPSTSTSIPSPSTSVPSTPVPSASTPAVPTTSSPTLLPIATPASPPQAAHSDNPSRFDYPSPQASVSSMVTTELSSSIPSIPDSKTTSRFSEDASSPQRPPFYILRKPPTNTGRQQLHRSLLKLADDVLCLELHFSFPGHGQFSCSGRSYSEAAAALFTQLQSKGLATNNPLLPEERTILPLNYHKIVPHVARDFEKLCQKKGSVRWKYELKLPGWEPVSESGQRIGTTLTFMPLFDKYVKIGAICVVDSEDDLLQEPMLHNGCKYTSDDCDIDEADASEEQESDSHFPSSSSGSNSISSLVLDIAEPASMDLTCAENVEASPLPPPYQVTSLRSAKRDLEAIPGCEILFETEVVLPSHGSVKVSDCSSNRVRRLLLHELIKRGVITKNRHRPLVRDTLPLNYLDQDIYLFVDLERITRSYAGASFSAQWSLILPGRPQLLRKAEGKRAIRLHWHHLVEGAVEAGYIEIKPSENSSPDSPASSTKPNDQPLPTKPAPSSPSSLDALSDPSSTTPDDLDSLAPVTERTSDDVNPSTSTTKQEES